MREREIPEAHILEKLGVWALLWLEKHLEQKPETLSDLKRRQFVKRATMGTLGVVLVGSGGLGAFKLLEGDRQPLTTSPTPESPPSKADPSEGYYRVDWQRQEEILQLLKKAREDKNLLILEPNPIRLRAVKNNFFYQTTNGVILAIDQQATAAWLSQYPKNNQQVALIYIDKMNPTTSLGRTARFYEDIDELWQNSIKRQTPEEMSNNLASHLSAGIALVNDYVSQYGGEGASQILSISQKGTAQWQITQEEFWNYIDRFRNGQLPLLIRVLAINPLWIEQKLPQ